MNLSHHFVSIVCFQEDGGIDVEMDDDIILEDVEEGMNDDALNINAEDDQLLTEDVSCLCYLRFCEILNRTLMNNQHFNLGESVY